MHTTPTLTYFATHFTNGHTRRVAISLPYVACIADDPHYAAPPPEPEPEPPAQVAAPAALVGKVHPPNAGPRPEADGPAAPTDWL